MNQGVRWRSPAALGALCGLLFVAGAAPGLTWLDAGELGASAWELGVAHPPGFPVFLLLHKALMLLLPLGDIAFRGNLASGVVGALALSLLAVAGRRWGLGAWPLFVSLLAAAMVPALALHAVTIEVYTGVGLYVSACLALLARPAGEALDARKAVCVAFLTGLGLGHHAELRLLALPMLALGWAGTGFSRRAAVFAIFAGLLGASVVLYLPLRAAAEPWRDWGHPATPDALWDHLMATRIRLAYAEQLGAVTSFNVQRFGQDVLGALGLLGLAALPGLWSLGRRPAGLAVLAVIVIDLAYAVAVNPMGLRDLQNGLPTVLALALAAAAGLDAGLSRIAGRGQRLAFGAAALLGFIVFWGRWPFDRTTDRGLPRLLEAALDDAPPTAALFVASDNLAAGLAFAQVVEGARPDVGVLVRQHLWDRSSVGPVARRLPWLFAPSSQPASLEAMPALLERRGLRWEAALGGASELRPRGLVPAFPLFHGAHTPGAPAPVLRASAFTIRLEASGSLVEPQARVALARLFVDLAEGTGALTAFDRALEVEPGSAALIESRRAAVLARFGQGALALAAALRALAAAPHDVRLRCSVARYTFNLGEPIAAAELLDGVLEEVDDDAEALGLRGLARAQLGRYEDARTDFSAALKLDPGQPEAVAGMENLKKLEK